MVRYTQEILVGCGLTDFCWWGCVCTSRISYLMNIQEEIRTQYSTQYFPIWSDHSTSLFFVSQGAFTNNNSIINISKYTYAWHYSKYFSWINLFGPHNAVNQEIISSILPKRNWDTKKSSRSSATKRWSWNSNAVHKSAELLRSCS